VEVAVKTDQVRRRLTRERARLERVLQGLQDERGPDGKDWGTMVELSAVDQHPADLGSENFERDKGMSILYNVEAELADVDRALRRISEGVYGRCEACGSPIGAARLEARPAARFCIEDQARVERGARSA
jgi:RNA polymerase-binding transcription factor DksA